VIAESMTNEIPLRRLMFPSVQYPETSMKNHGYL